MSVSDKTGLVEFLSPFYKQGMRIVSTGGTADHLKKNGFQVTDVSEQTGFPEVMGGRVKTLHPRIHMATLARPNSEQDESLLQEQNLEAFDLVICNLYPFADAFQKKLSEAEMLEKIDVGGPTMLRAAAKNFKRLSVIVDPSDYQWISQKISNSGTLQESDRKKLSAKVFVHTSAYDALIGQYLGGSESECSFAGQKVQSLRYGENPHQSATWYSELGHSQGLHAAKILQGKELSFNNILDLHAAVTLVQSLSMPAAVAVKHNNPCGAAQAATISSAIQKCLAADPVSVFGAIVAVNQKIGAAEAESLSKVFLECVIAPEFSEEALVVFSAKKNLRVLSWPALVSTPCKTEIKSVFGGFLVQQSDEIQSNAKAWNFLGEKPQAQIHEDLLFSEKVCATLKSNSIAIVRSGQTLGLGMGQVNRVDAVEQAIQRMRLHFTDTANAVLASDAFFPFPDSIERIAKAGIRWVLQPGGSVKDNEVFEAAKKNGINLVITGKRHFRH